MCPEGLSGGLEPVQLSIPQLPVWDMNTLSRPVCESLQLQVDLPWAMLSDKLPFFPCPCKVSTPPSSIPLVADSPNEAANHTSMAAELQGLLSQMVLDTSGPALGDSTMRRPISAAWVTPSTIREEDPLRPDRPDSALPKPVATSLQVLPQAARPEEAVPISHLPSSTLTLEIHMATSVPAATQPGAHPGQIQAPSPMRYFNCKRRCTGPWGIYL